MNSNAFKRIQVLLKQLSEQALEVDKINAQSKSHKLLADNVLFSETLFSTQSDKLSPYIKEVEKRIDELQRLISAGKKEFAFNQIPHIEEQMASIVNAINANQSMHEGAQHRLNAINANRYKKAAKSVMLSSHELHQKLAEHHEFERRLAEMITDREQKRTENTQAQTQQMLSQEILALHQRLGRCRQAISKIERQIEFTEKRNAQSPYT